jgi:hypothetical protein
MNGNTSFEVFISSTAFRLQTVCDLKNVDSCSLMSTHFWSTGVLTKIRDLIEAK